MRRRARRPPRILVANRQRSLAVPASFVRRVARAALAEGRFAGTCVEVTLVDDATLRRLNRLHLGDPRPTDVMAFDYRDGGDPVGGPAAEVLVSAERARVEAESRGHAPIEELGLYLAHGCLHLCGFRDHTQAAARRMRAAEAAALRKVGLPHRFGRPL